MRSILLAALAAALLPMPAAAQDAPNNEMVIMRRVLTDLKQPEAELVQEILTGNTYGWYNVCITDSGARMTESPMQLCVRLSETGAVGIENDLTLCSTPQSAVHTLFLAQKSAELLGGAGALVKAGPKPAVRECSNPPTRGYGYMCVGDGYLHCFSVDSEDTVVQVVDPSRCAAPQKSGLNIDAMLKANAMFSVGNGVTGDICQLPAQAFGRKDTCSWTTGQGGERTLSLTQSCFKVAQDRTVTPATMSECSKAPPTTAQDHFLLRYIGLKPSDATPQSCVNKDATANLVSRIAGDTSYRDGNGYLIRRIDYTFQCKRFGVALVNKAPCAEQIAQWGVEQDKFANSVYLYLEATQDIAAGTRRETYTNYSDRVEPN